jgi:PPOX class probable F420-dependent enzyme
VHHTHGIAKSKKGGASGIWPERGGATMMAPTHRSYEVAMLPDAVRRFIDGGPLAHVVTLSADGTPHVSMAWVGLDGDELLIGTIGDQAKLRNLRRDPRVALSFVTGARNPYGLDEYLVLHGRATVTAGGAPELLGRLARTYIGPDVIFPPMPDPPAGYVTRVRVEAISGIGQLAADAG